MRVMPNTPALVGVGASVFCLNQHATDADRQLVRKLLSAVGLFTLRNDFGIREQCTLILQELAMSFRRASSTQ